MGPHPYTAVQVQAEKKSGHFSGLFLSHYVLRAALINIFEYQMTTCIVAESLN